MEAMEFIGRSTEEAIRQAQDHFQLPLERLEVEVISAGSSGILGIFGGKKAKVMVRPIGDSTKEAMDQVLKEFKEGTGGDRTGSAEKSRAENKAKADSAPARQEAAPPKPAAAPSPPAPKPAAPQKDEAEEEDQPATVMPKRHAIADYSSSAPIEKEADAATAPPPVENTYQPPVSNKPAVAEEEGEGEETRREQREPEKPEVVEEARKVLARLVAALDDNAAVDGQGSGFGIELEVSGGEVGILIGRRGQTLDALQYLTTRIISHQEGRPVRVTVDAGGYRQRRREGLEDMARRMAQKARQSKKTVTVGPFNAQERRVVHLALKDMGGVTTASRGRGEMKKVLISPK